MSLLCPTSTIRVYDDPSAFQLLEQEWKALFREWGGWNVFLSWQWFHRWWGSFGTDKELQILTLRRDGRLAGIAPMMVETEDSGVRKLALIGSHQTTDYCDLLAGPRDVAALCEALADFIRSGFDRWQRVEFCSLSASSPLLGTLRERLAEWGFDHRVSVVDTCPAVRLAPTWDEYLATLGKKDRHELRRKIRRAQMAGEQRVRHLADPREIEGGLEEFFRLHRASAVDKAAFLDDTMARFFAGITLDFAEEGWARLNLMSLDGREAAASLSFSRGDRVLLYNSGLDPDFRSHSVGIALHAAEIAQAVNQGKAWYDFLRGNEPYKYGFGAQDHPIYGLSAWTGRNRETEVDRTE